MRAEPFRAGLGSHRGMGDRVFVTAVAAGLLALGMLASHRATASQRLVHRAEAGGLAHAQLAVREMG